jgi:uncharacterized SAM-binding protein YcdF (DUF218 family)
VGVFVFVLVVVVGFVLAWVLAASALRWMGASRPAPNERFDAIVVLGCRVRDGQASAAFGRRLDVACALLREGIAPTLVITGGKVGSHVTEAEAGRTYVLSHGLAPVDRIVLEDRATTTRENASLTRALIGDVPVLIVTTDWHVPRARRVFLRSFMRVEAASAPGKLRGALREVAAWLVSA